MSLTSEHPKHHPVEDILSSFSLNNPLYAELYDTLYRADGGYVVTQGMTGKWLGIWTPERMTISLDQPPQSPSVWGIVLHDGITYFGQWERDSEGLLHLVIPKSMTTLYDIGIGAWFGKGFGDAARKASLIQQYLTTFADLAREPDLDGGHGPWKVVRSSDKWPIVWEKRDQVGLPAKLTIYELPLFRPQLVLPGEHDTAIPTMLFYHLAGVQDDTVDDASLLRAMADSLLLPPQA